MLRFLLEKEFKQIRRDKFLPKIIFLIPVMQLIILPFAANFEMRNINLCIVNQDHSVLASQLEEKILSSEYFRLTNHAEKYADALTSIEENQADVILEIPPHFEHDLQKEGAADVHIAANAVNGTKGGLAVAYLNSIIQDFNAEKANSKFEQPNEYIKPEETKEPMKATPSSVSMKPGHPQGITSIQLYNPHLSYKVFMVPGIMAFLLTVISAFLSTLNIVSEKEKGTIEQINVTPVPKSLFLLSKLIPFWVIGFVLLTIAILVAWIIYGLTPTGSYGVIYLFAAVYLIAFTGFGLTISSISSTQQQAMLTAFFIMIIFVLLSGLFTPISSMPEWAQKITLLNPIRYFIEVIRMVYLKGSTLSDLSGHFLTTCLFAVFFNALAIISYRKKE